jgi:hypothetical protein
VLGISGIDGGARTLLNVDGDLGFHEESAARFKQAASSNKESHGA